MTISDQVLAPTAETLGTDAHAAVQATGADASVEVRRGRPAHVLRELSDPMEDDSPRR